MKTVKILFIALLAFVGTASMAQVKIAYINSQEIIEAMPELDSVKIKLTAQRQELQNQIEAMEVELNKKTKDFQNNYTSWSQAMQQQKGKEIEDIRTNMQAFGQAAPQQLQKAESDLMSPIIKKIQDAVNAIGKENGFTYILDTTVGAIIYLDEATAINAAPLVLAKLGIKK